MHLIIDNYGVDISINNAMVKIQHGEDKRSISLLKIRSINIMKPSSLTSSFLIACAEKQIPVLIYNEIGQVEAWVYSPQYRNIANVRIAQALFSKRKEAIDWMQEIHKIKLNAQIDVLHHLAERKIKYQSSLKEVAAVLHDRLSLLDMHRGFDTIRGWEGKNAAMYWQAIGEVIADKVNMRARVHRQPEDVLNNSLNYGYGILYGVVEASLLMVGLDSNMGIMHTNRYARPALAYDHIEAFRPWVDKVILRLILSDQISSSDLEESNLGTASLTGGARRLLIENVFDMLEEKAYLQGKRIKRHDHIHYLSARLVEYLKKIPL